MAITIRVKGNFAYINIVVNDDQTITLTSSICDKDCIKYFLKEALSSIEKTQPGTTTNGKIHTALE